MNLRSLILIIAGLLCFPGLSTAQNFGVLESAETIDQGNFKLVATPIFVFGKNGGSGDNHVVIGVGYGFTSRFDAEAKVAFGETRRSLVVTASIGCLKMTRSTFRSSGVSISRTMMRH